MESSLACELSSRNYISDSRLWQYHRTVPSLYAFRFLGFPFSSKTMSYILASQLVLSQLPGSALASACGLVTGYLYRTDTPFLLPSVSRPRRLWRPLKAYRVPLSVHNLLARIFTPLLGNSAPPRRSTRVLPGQIRDAADDAAVAPPPTGLRGLAARAGLATAAPTRRPTAVTTAAAAGGEVTPAGNGNGEPGARAAMGEWVNEMTGRGGTRAPTEQEIAAWVKNGNDKLTPTQALQHVPQSLPRDRRPCSAT